MKRPARSDSLWFAYLLHRLSGILLSLFLPIHFFVLSLALTDTARFDQALQFSTFPMVKLVEFVLVFLLAVHCFGGLRLLALEWLPWPASQKSLAAGALAISLLIASIFLLQAM
ncbi:MAG: succinate dehydrogenase [Granulosicoccus sp.]|nr:succinate dehydrogenase [Granulosicoccus sp.]